MEVDYVIGPPYKDARSQQRQAPMVRMFGVNEAGNSVAVFVYGFEPYFYLECPSAWGPDEIQMFERTLRSRCRVRLLLRTPLAAAPLCLQCPGR